MGRNLGGSRCVCDPHPPFEIRTLIDAKWRCVTTLRASLRLASAASVWLTLGALGSSCLELGYVDTATPEDARFTLGCIGGCGVEGREPGMLLEVSFTSGGRDWSRQYALCCKDRPALRARLQTIKDLWCDGVPVPKASVGDLLVGTTKSDATGKRGATIDDGEGYVAFNCGEWLERLIHELGSTDCCADRTKGKKKKR